jgi:hypothetical protein
VKSAALVVFTHGLVTALIVCSCSRQIEVGRRLSSDSDAIPTTANEAGPHGPASADAATSDAATLSKNEAGACQPQRCRGKLRACGDCVDNDADGQSDSADPDCWSPCDDSEATLGDDRVCPGTDCFFDPDCGLGNDETCSQLTPNGCDCWGCCMVPGSEQSVFLGSSGADGQQSCTAASLDDPMSCQPCTRDPACTNACEACEQCFLGSELGPECANDAGCAIPQCPAEHAACGACSGACATDAVCVTGCCVDAP